MSSNINLASLTNSQGFSITGALAGSNSGNSVSAGDVNGDGYSDVIIGAPAANNYTGVSYVVYGGNSIGGTTNLTSLTVTQGFSVTGALAGSYSGYSVSGTGDINKDGYDDIIIGAPWANNYTGISYVVYGGASLPLMINLSSLTATQGFLIIGANINDYSGYSVSGAGDINNDSFADIIIGAPGVPYASSSNYSGISYVIFGKASGLSNIQLNTLTSTQGFSIIGANADDNSGFSVSGAGDINKDGFDDVIIASPIWNSATSNSYVIWGKASGFVNIQLNTLTSIQGFYTTGVYINSAVSGAGDINGDGYDDVLVGAPNTGTNGISYVIFGNVTVSNINLKYITNNQGFSITGAIYDDYSGWSVSGLGDINKDGYDDIIIGAYPDYNAIGMSYVIYGKSSGFNNMILSSLTPSQGFSINGTSDYLVVAAAGDINKDGYYDIIIGEPDANSHTGISYIIYGAPTAETPTAAPTSIITTLTPTKLPTSAPSAALTNTPTLTPTTSPTLVSTFNPTKAPTFLPSAVPTKAPTLTPTTSLTLVPTFNPTKAPTLLPSAVPTKAPTLTPVASTSSPTHVPTIVPTYMPTIHQTAPTAMPTIAVPASNINLAYLVATQGFSVNGTAASDSGFSVGDAGDVNGDGYDDVIIGAPSANSNAGLSYVIYGRASPASTINLASLTVTQGFTIIGANAGDKSGFSVSGAGDVNNDGYDDVIIGVPYANSYAGAAYVIYGKSSLPSVINLASLGTQGFSITGVIGSQSGSSVSGAGDVNGDGYDDIIVCAPIISCYKYPQCTGSSYVIYGGASISSTIILTSLTTAQGFSIGGINTYAYTYIDSISTSSAGDVNGDGYADIIIGAPSTNCDNNGCSGASYVIFGGTSISFTINIATLGMHGFYIIGAVDSGSGDSVSGAGDVNNDGYADVIIGAVGSGSCTSDDSCAGASYVIYGGLLLANTTINLTNIGLQGFSITGTISSTSSQSGLSVSGAGDINRDGYDDIIIGAVGANENAGEFYVIYGSISPKSTISLASLTSAQGFSLSGIRNSGGSGVYVSGAGDVNGDGYDDIIMGMSQVSCTTTQTGYVCAGESYIVYGSASGLVTALPIMSPTSPPALGPTIAPTYVPTFTPIIAPTYAPTFIPTISPTFTPTNVPTSMPTQAIEITSGGTYNGTASNENFIINSSSDITITGSGGSDMYTIEPNANVLITVTDFDNSSSLINLKAFNIYSFGELNITAGSIVITLEDNQIMKLLQLNPGDINANNFVFAPPIPSMLPTGAIDGASSSSTDNNDVGIITGSTIGGIALVSMVGYGLYAYIHHFWPFIGESLASKAVDAGSYIGDSAL